MADENHNLPLAPATIFKRSDEEAAPAAASLQKRRWPSIKEHRSSKCLVYILIWLILQAALALVLALVIFRVETPKFRIDHIIIQNLQYSTSPSSPSLTATLTAEVAIQNKNFGRFKIQNGTSIVVLYRRVALGDKVPVPAESVKGRSTKKVNVTLEVRSEELLSPSADLAKNLTIDLNSGTVALTSYAKLKGKVEVLGIVRRRKSPEMNCTVAVHLSTREVQELLCR